MCASTRSTHIVAYVLQQRCQVREHVLLDRDIELFSCNSCQTRRPLSLRQLIVPDPLPVRTYENRFPGPRKIYEFVVCTTYTISTRFDNFTVKMFT